MTSGTCTEAKRSWECFLSGVRRADWLLSCSWSVAGSVWLKNEGEMLLLREWSSLWAKTFEGCERRGLGGISQLFCWAVVLILVYAVSWML
jgi:hypothetical protein